MPYRSAKQRRLIFVKAAQGEEWARKFIRVSGDTPPKLRKRKKLKRAQ